MGRRHDTLFVRDSGGERGHPHDDSKVIRERCSEVVSVGHDDSRPGGQPESEYPVRWQSRSGCATHFLWGIYPGVASCDSKGRVGVIPEKWDDPDAQTAGVRGIPGKKHGRLPRRSDLRNRGRLHSGEIGAAPSRYSEQTTCGIASEFQSESIAGGLLTSGAEVMLSGCFAGSSSACRADLRCQS